jgi:3-isopropylmalate dehydrogenase
MERATIAVFPGDGIGPEVTTQARAVLALCAERFDLQLEFVEGLIGGGAIDRDGTALPDASLALAKRSDAVLLGAVGGPKWDNPQSKVRPEQALLGLRRSLELFANLRPIVAHPALIDAAPLKREVLEGIDILFVRELTGGVYFGQPSERRQGPNGREAIDTTLYSEGEVARVTRLAFQLAQQRRKHLTQVDKANILATSRLWREVTHEIAAGWPTVVRLASGSVAVQYRLAPVLWASCTTVGATTSRQVPRRRIRVATPSANRRSGSDRSQPPSASNRPTRYATVLRWTPSRAAASARLPASGNSEG